MANMNAESLQCFEYAVLNLLNRWDGFKLAVEHMGGRNGHQTAIEIKDYVYNYCIQNENVTPNEIGEILNEILDEEFDTICEDNSVRDLSEHLIGHLKLCIEGKFDEVRQRIAQLPNCVNWLDPNFKMTRAPKTEDDSDSSSDDDDQEMDTDDDNQAPELVDNQRNQPQIDEDGFTMISSKRRNR